MISIKRIKPFLFFSFFLALSVYGSVSSDRAFDDGAMETYANDPQYAYMNYTIQPPTIWDQIQWFLWDLWAEFWSNPVTSRLTIWLFILTMLGVAVFFIIRMKFRGALQNSSNQTIPDAYISIDDERIDYNELISASLDQNDFKNAIRWLYLKGLAKLAQRERIRLAEWKTPYDYQIELTGKMIDPYAKLSLLFEYVWYGDFDVKRADYEKGRNYLEILEESIE